MSKKLKILISLVTMIAILSISLAVFANSNVTPTKNLSASDKVENIKLSRSGKDAFKALITKNNLKAIDLADVPSDVKVGKVNDSAEF